MLFRSACGHHLHPTAGTIFHKSSTSLHLWFYAMYLFTTTRNGVAAKDLQRALGVTYSEGWGLYTAGIDALFHGPLIGASLRF